MSKGALEAMLAVTGQEEFISSMKLAAGAMTDLAATADAVSMNMVAASSKMDVAFGAQRVAGMRAFNAELGVTKSHLKDIVGMLGGKGVLAGFGLYEGIKTASKIATNGMMWQTEAGVPASQVAGLQKMAMGQARLGISSVDAGQLIRMVESAYMGKATSAQIQSLFQNSSNLAAISGGRIHALDAGSLLIPAVQADPKLRNNFTAAAGIVNAMVGSGNMTTQDAMAVLSQKTLGTLSGLGIGLQDLAPFFAFGADTRGGQQAAQFANLLPTSVFNLAKGGANKAGKAELKSLLPGVDIMALMRSPDGLTKVVKLLLNAEQSRFGGALTDSAELANMDIFGGSRGGATPLSIAGNYGLFQSKDKQVIDLSDPAFYTNAAKIAQLNPQQKFTAAKAGFSNALGQLGEAALPALTAALPTLANIFHELGGPAKEGLTIMAEAFKVLANPVVLRVVEGLILLKGASMIYNGIGGVGARIGAAQGGLMMGGPSSFLGASPAARYRASLAGSMGLDGAVTSPAGMLGPSDQSLAGRSTAMASAFDKARYSATELRTALVGRGGAGAALGATIGYTTVASGGGMLEGGLTGALSGALMGMSAGPWGAAVGAVGGAAGAIVGHFAAMGKAAAENAAAVKASISSITAAGTSPGAYIASDISGNMDLQLGLRKLGITQQALQGSTSNPAQLAAWRKAAYGLQGNQGTQVRDLIDTVTGLPGAKRLSDTVSGKAVSSFSAPSDQAIFNWAVATGIFPKSEKGTAGALLPSVRDITGSIRQDYATKHGMFWSKDTGFSPTKATGGRVHAGVSYLVGENGPEMFMPGASGSIITNRNLSMMGQGGSGRTLHIGELHVHGTEGMSPADLAHEVTNELARVGARL